MKEINKVGLYGIISLLLAGLTVILALDADEHLQIGATIVFFMCFIYFYAVSIICLFRMNDLS